MKRTARIAGTWLGMILVAAKTRSTSDVRLSTETAMKSCRQAGAIAGNFAQSERLWTKMRQEW
jgi:hypothetical protein